MPPAETSGQLLVHANRPQTIGELLLLAALAGVPPALCAWSLGPGRMAAYQWVFVGYYTVPFLVYRALLHVLPCSRVAPAAAAAWGTLVPALVYWGCVALCAGGPIRGLDLLRTGIPDGYPSMFMGYWLPFFLPLGAAGAIRERCGLRLAIAWPMAVVAQLAALVVLHLCRGPSLV